MTKEQRAFVKKMSEVTNLSDGTNGLIARIATRYVNYTCKGCQKIFRQKIMAVCILSPWNLNEDGTIKSEPEVKRQAGEKLQKRVERFKKLKLCAECRLNAPKKVQDEIFSLINHYN